MLATPGLIAEFSGRGSSGLIGVVAANMAIKNLKAGGWKTAVSTGKSRLKFELRVWWRVVRHGQMRLGLRERETSDKAD